MSWQNNRTFLEYEDHPPLYIRMHNLATEIRGRKMQCQSKQDKRAFSSGF